VGQASRVIEGDAGYVLGCLAVPNYGRRGDLHLLVYEAGRIGTAEGARASDGGSAMFVIATDAPLSERQLRRLAGRAAFGLGRAATYSSNTSGDYAIAFSTAHRVPHQPPRAHEDFRFLRDDAPALRDLFEAAADATYEAILNSLCVADAMDGRDGHRVEAFPYELLERLRGTSRA
jgi:D-aminopeptidase